MKARRCGPWRSPATKLCRPRAMIDHGRELGSGGLLRRRELAVSVLCTSAHLCAAGCGTGPTTTLPPRRSSSPDGESTRAFDQRQRPEFSKRQQDRTRCDCIDKEVLCTRHRWRCGIVCAVASRVISSRLPVPPLKAGSSYCSSSYARTKHRVSHCSLGTLTSIAHTSFIEQPRDVIPTTASLSSKCGCARRGLWPTRPSLWRSSPVVRWKPGVL